jgi:hypothetical protein
MNKKIEIHVRQELPISPTVTKVFWQYVCTTIQAKNCKDAVTRYCVATGRKPSEVRACYQ